MKSNHHWLAWTIGICSVVGLVLLGAGLYFYQMAVVPGQKSFIKQASKLKPSDPNYREKYWYAHAKKQRWFETSATDHLKLDANYLPAAHKTNKTVVVMHGFMNDKSTMGAFAGLFHELGYNILVPDDRAQGDSEGKTITFGWQSRLDFIKWSRQIVKRNGPNAQIVMFGISMGASGMVMASGEANLPPQIKAFVVDSPYTSADAEISYQAKTMYHLPRWPLVPITSAITRVRAGYSFQEASALKQVKKDKTPILFISGTADDFVPHKMTLTLYHATKAPKELLTVAGAKHVQSFEKSPQRYRSTVSHFLKQYLKN